MLRLAALALICRASCHTPARKPTTTVAAAPALQSESGSGSGSESGSAPAKPQGIAGWELPATWRREVIPFPLDFAPSLPHRGFEELRFPPGFFDPTAGTYWSYAFVWRTDDDALLDASALGAELTAYFRGLIAAVDQDRRITARDQIVARAEPQPTPERFALTAHVFDAFKTALPLDLTGWARRRACATGGALWIFVLARPDASIRGELDALANGASC